MKAMYSGTGIYISLGKEDKELKENGNNLEAILDTTKKKVILKIKKKVKNGAFEEPGFHIVGTKTKYKINMEESIWNKLTGDIPENEFTNYWLSRSMYDRIEFVYWEPKQF